MSVKCEAAVAFQPLEPLRIVIVEVEAPKAGEVRIKMTATSVCHTDVYTWLGADPEGVFPCILGHEGAGIVESVGEGVESVVVGDHVVPLYTPECRQCKFCKSKKTNLCGAIRATQGRGLMPDGTTRFSYEGRPVYHYMGCSTFSKYTVLPEISVAKVQHQAPLESLCLLGCGIPTGIGAVCNTAKIFEGATCAVFGLGCVGLAAILGCRMRKASRIIAIDTNTGKFELALQLGATDVLDPKALPEGCDIKDQLIEMTDGGVDYSFECIGNVNTMRQALEATHKGWGQSIIVGVAAANELIQTRPFQLVTGRTWKGTAFGGVRGRSELPSFVEMIMSNEIPISAFITDTLPFDQIHTCFEHPKQGSLNIRTVLEYSQ
eukprot:Gregarina_sp_Poly_1__6021@NODE_3175_length_1302_cov_359_193522_g2018_i0_p1_GENE_NODE_3175_length_1302_cov_359_193522_g2018_i0NODE_3175_length_1302_cov_359_193522_g2018_i0_p1_ORF_typecomplete_len377_score41_40ADH_N/PF08240_12/3_8e32ADH_zinc_N/PF00107_26/1_2e27Glu_dehyd_C/PF16912_5/2_3e12AlaDh_PNT_C/PF01262_21/0_014ELFV_dehydrog/PF00208_21/0_14_NODE_3175_length_1302_cov_359_193522_g2018_i0761206